MKNFRPEALLGQTASKAVILAKLLDGFIVPIREREHEVIHERVEHVVFDPTHPTNQHSQCSSDNATSVGRKVSCICFLHGGIKLLEGKIRNKTTAVDG